MDKIITKNFADSYLYNLNTQANQKIMFEAILNGDRIDPEGDGFEDIRYEVKKRQVSPALSRVLISPKTVLLLSPTPMPKAFKVFVAKDVKASKPDYKVFIDCSDIIRYSDGVYKCSNVDILISYLFSGMSDFIYYMEPKKLIFASDISKYGASAFAKMFTHVVDYLYKISSTYTFKDKCIYLSAMYFLVGIMKKDMSDSVKSLCRNISKLSEREEQVLLMSVEEDDFLNIKFFVELVADKLKLSKLTVENIVDKWVWQFGTGTQYALELFPAFSNMLTNVYIGAYINQQKTIEKVAGRDITEFASAVREIGGACV